MGSFLSAHTGSSSRCPPPAMRVLMLRPSLALLGFGLLVISACSPAHYVAELGRESILGMDADTLKSCAGIPTRTEQLNSRTALYSYENKYERTGGAEITFPLICARSLQ